MRIITIIVFLSLVTGISAAELMNSRGADIMKKSGETDTMTRADVFMVQTKPNDHFGSSEVASAETTSAAPSHDQPEETRIPGIDGEPTLAKVEEALSRWENFVNRGGAGQPIVERLRVLKSTLGGGLDEEETEEEELDEEVPVVEEEVAKEEVAGEEEAVDEEEASDEEDTEDTDESEEDDE